MPLLPAPDAEPGPPELGTAPEVPVLLLPGVDVVPPALDPLVPPALEPLPLVMPSSFRHFSRSVPTMPRHLLLALPEAPLELLPAALGELLLGEAALGELLLGELLLGELVLGELLLGELLLGELVLGELVLGEVVAPVELLPDAPDELPEALSDELLPVAPALLPALPLMPPDEEPEVWASVTLESARSAAAVAALISFNVISVLPPYLGVPAAPPLLPEPMPEPLLLPVPELGCLGVVLLPDAPLLLGELLLGALLLELLPLVPPLEAAPAPDFSLEVAPAPDFLKCASHSSREICPSPFLSTEVKLGAWLLAPLEAPAFGALEAPPAALLSGDLPAALLPEDAGGVVSEGLLLLEAPPEALSAGLLLLEAPPEALSEDLLSVAPALEPLGFDASPLVLCARATPASAKSAAAVAVLTTLTNMEIPPRGIGENCSAK